jgi:hypothetical protein
VEISAYFAQYFEAYIGDAVAMLVYIVVGVRLCALSRRSGQLPDRLLSASFLLWALSYAVYDIPDLFFYRGEQLPTPIAFGSLFATYLGTATFTLFTLVVFRKRERWAGALVAGALSCLFIGLTGSVWVGDWAGEAPLSNPWWWVARVGNFIPYCWVGAEGFHHYGKARQHRQLGMCEPMDCNRFLLWGLAGALWAVLIFIDAAQYIAYELTGEWSSTLSAWAGWHEFVPGIVIGLVFFPPAAYRRWVEKGTERNRSAARISGS